MGLMAILAACGGGGQELKTQTFSANATFVSPTNKINSAVGRGGSGTDATSGADGYVVQTVYKRFVDEVLDAQTFDYKYYTGVMPGDYCTGQMSSGGVREEWCYYHTFYSGNTEATTGPSTTAFGKTFPGRTGAGTAANTTFTDVPVVIGQSYNIVVPSGGSLTIQYYQ